METQTEEIHPEAKYSFSATLEHTRSFVEEEPVVTKIPVREEQVDIKNILSTLRREPSHESQDPPEHTGIHPEPAATHPFDFDRLEYKGTLFRTYIMATDEDSFYLIDQHAAHERIFYEKLLAEYARRDKLRQTLLLPLNFNVSAQVCASEDAWISQVSDLGYDIEFFGNHTYLVREIPAFMELPEAEDFLRDVFTSLEDRPDLTDRSRLEKIITRACKSAVKGGDSLAEEEIDALIRDLKRCHDPFSCPHGRPTFIRMKKYEIERLFKRV